MTDADFERTRTSGLIRIIDRMIDAGAFLAASLLIAVMLATTIKVVFRYGLREGLIGVDQISGTMLLYIAFLGAAWVLRREQPSAAEELQPEEETAKWNHHEVHRTWHL